MTQQTASYSIRPISQRYHPSWSEAAALLLLVALALRVLSLDVTGLTGTKAFTWSWPSVGF